MSDMENFDKHFKDAFSDFSPEVPNDAWEKILAERNRRKPAVFFWRFLNTQNILVAAVILIGGALTVWKMTTNFSSINITAEKNKIPANTDAVNHLDKPEEISRGNKTETTKSNRINNYNKNRIEQTDNKISAPQKDSKQTDFSSSSTERKNKTFILAEENTNSNYLKNKNKITTGNVANIATVNTNLNNNESAVEEFKTDENKNSEQWNQSFLNRLYFDATKITSSMFKNNTAQKINLKAIAYPSCPEIEKDAAGNKTYWEIYAGPDYAFKKYNDTANSVYIQKRKETTSFQSAYSAGFRYTKVFGNGISVRTGLNFSQINEKFSFIQSNLVQVNYIIDPVTGDTTGSYTVKGTRYKTTFNHYHTIDIPLLLGYEMGNGKLHANINAGAIVNIFSWQKGELLDTAYQPVSISSGKQSSPYQYKSNIGVGFMAAVSIYYKLNERMHLLAEPYLRYNFSPMSKDNFSLQEKFTSIGLRFGLRVDIK